jgi:hypothetical protein
VPFDDAASASNWLRIILLDLLLGLAAAVAGGWLAVVRHRGYGWVVLVAGAAYAVLVTRRGLRWRRLRATRPPPQER